MLSLFIAVSARPAWITRRRQPVGLMFAILAGLTAVSPESFAQGVGDLLVSPTRIVFEGRQRSAEVTLVNRGSAAATYRIAFKNMRMLDSGGYRDVDKARAGELFADRLIRYAPRQIRLQPGVAQTIRLLVRKPSDLASGEYRSHLRFQAIPGETKGRNIEAIDLKKGEIRALVQVIFGVTIPVIVRHGQLSASVGISGLVLKPGAKPGGAPVLTGQIARTGDRSVYGDLNVVFTPDGGKDTTVGLARGFAVFTPNSKRLLRIPLAPPKNLHLRGGRLKVTYRARPDKGSRVLAKAEI